MVDVHPITATTSQETINKLRQTFTTLGIHRKIVSDNAAVFTNSEFQEFLSRNGIVHHRS